MTVLTVIQCDNPLCRTLERCGETDALGEPRRLPAGWVRYLGAHYCGEGCRVTAEAARSRENRRIITGESR